MKLLIKPGQDLVDLLESVDAKLSRLSEAEERAVIPEKRQRPSPSSLLSGVTEENRHELQDDVAEDKLSAVVMPWQVMDWTKSACSTVVAPTDKGYWWSNAEVPVAEAVADSDPAPTVEECSTEEYRQWAEANPVSAAGCWRLRLASRSTSSRAVCSTMKAKPRMLSAPSSGLLPPPSTLTPRAGYPLPGWQPVPVASSAAAAWIFSSSTICN
jgi:hypothetical protein